MKRLLVKWKTKVKFLMASIIVSISIIIKTMFD